MGNRLGLAPADGRAVLSTLRLLGAWKVSRARSGWSRRTFVAANGARRLFLKFDVAVDPLVRLGQLGVSPTVLHAGEYLGHSFVVQPYVEGRHPSVRWFEGHLPGLAALVRAYQSDARLRELASFAPPLTYQQHVAGVVDDLEARARSAAARQDADGGLLQAVGLLRRRSGDLHDTDLVATHGDPNRKNLILAEDLSLVDWDDLALSDPLRDVGQLLWWYVPRKRWRDFFELFGTEADGAHDGLYWWVAAESLDVAIKLAERRNHEHAQEFLDDFAAAIEQQANPHAPF